MLKAFVLMMATMFAVFSLPVMADSVEKFSVADHAVLVGDVSQPAVAIAECDRCMYAGLGDREPLMIASKSEFDGLSKVTDNAWTGPYEVGWRN